MPDRTCTLMMTDGDNIVGAIQRSLRGPLPSRAQGRLHLRCKRFLNPVDCSSNPFLRLIYLHTLVVFRPAHRPKHLRQTDNHPSESWLRTLEQTVLHLAIHKDLRSYAHFARVGHQLPWHLRSRTSKMHGPILPLRDMSVLIVGNASIGLVA